MVAFVKTKSKVLSLNGKFVASSKLNSQHDQITCELFLKTP
jgi:hypothetical protein